MARVKITTYRNSVLASLISFIGTMVCLCGAMLTAKMVLSIFGGTPFLWALGIMLLGLLIVVAGIGIMRLGAYISERKEFNKFVKVIRERDLETAIQNSVEAALNAYLTNPTRMMRKYVISVNPAAQPQIEQYHAQLALKREEEKRKAEETAKMWNCSMCGHKNPENVLCCQKCSHVR